MACIFFTTFSKTISLFLRIFFLENSVLMYGLYSRAAYGSARTVVDQHKSEKNINLVENSQPFKI